MSAYRKDFNETKYISFLIKNDELLEKCNEIWEKGSNSNKKAFYSKPVYNKRYLKTRTKSCEEKINTKFRNNKIPQEGCQCICLSLILIGSVYRKGKTYYSQVLLEEFKYFVKGK